MNKGEDVTDRGSSPHMRGTHRPKATIFHHRDHPRICGEHFAWDSTTDFDSGSSPHMRGTHPTLDIMPGDRRIIPAYAGNTPPRVPPPLSQRDHPRICGEHARRFDPQWRPTGSSPHMRGTQVFCNNLGTRLGIIPAYAGNTDWGDAFKCSMRDHPRICGEHDAISVADIESWGSSPHMRGTHRGRTQRDHAGGIIPAYAGNTVMP